VSAFDLAAAVELATRAHAGQVDKAGEPYIGHPLRVMGRVDGERARMVAVLHDVLEDTPVTAADLLSRGCPADVVEAVDALSKRPGESLEDSMRRVAAVPLALVVKRADLDDNTDPDRLASLPPDVADRLREKYRRSRALLGLADVAREAEALGYLNGTDFHVWHVPASLSSELVVLGLHGGNYTVWYRDMGQDRLLVRTADLATARQEFLAELARLAAPRGRGPYAGATAPGRYDGMTREQVYEAMQREGYFRDPV